MRSGNGREKFHTIVMMALLVGSECVHLLDGETVQAQAEPALVAIVERTPVGLNETVIVTLEVRLGVQTAAGVEATLSVRSHHSARDAVTAGSDFNLGLLDGGPEACEFDNTTGRIRYGAGKLGAAPTGTFTLCVIRFTSRQMEPAQSTLSRIRTMGGSRGSYRWDNNILASTAGRRCNGRSDVGSDAWVGSWRSGKAKWLIFAGKRLRRRGPPASIYWQ